MPSIMLKVMVGDEIEINAKMFYNVDKTLPGQGVDISPVIGGILTATGNPAGIVAGEAAQLAVDLGATVSQSTALVQVPKTNDNNDENVQPESGLKFVLYNSENFKPVDVNSGVRLVEDKINEIQDLHTDKMIMEQAGFLEIYLDNQAQTPVYFDNLTVVQSTGNVTEVNAYYPSGMIIGPLSFDAAKEKYNAYKYNAKELETALNLGYYNFGNRMLDPAIARFMVPDRFAEKYYNLSPYSYAANNPINVIDINGDSIGKVLEIIKTGLGKADDAVNKVASFVLDPIFGSGSKLNELDVKMTGSTYGDLEGHADGDLSGGNVKDLPDYAAVTVSGDLIVGGGVGGDVNLGYVKGEGVFLNATGRTGSGFDVSVGVGVSFGSYVGDKNQATATGLSGPGLYQSGGAGFVSGGAWQDISNIEGTLNVGRNWIGGSAGVSIGSKSFYSGSAGASYTTKPLYIYKSK